MATYYVTKAGNDSNDGSSGSPFLTIQHALDQTANNDTVIINDNGTYTESGLNRLRTGLTIKAGTGYTPVLDGEGSAEIGILAWITMAIEGLEIKRYTDYGIRGNASPRVYTVRDCHIHSIQKGSGKIGTAIGILDNGSVVERCKVHDIHGGGTGIDGTTYSITVKNCLVYKVSAGPGIFTTGTSTAVQNCTVDQIGSGTQVAYGLYVSQGETNHCIVSNCNTSIAGFRADSHTYNCVYANTSSDIYGGAGTGDITSNPLYTNRGDNDFTLSTTSPCITPAVSSSIAFEITKYVRDWTYGHKVDNVNSVTNHDMGCYEEVITNIMGIKTDDVSKVVGI